MTTQLAELERKLAALPDPNELNTPRLQHEALLQRHMLSKRIHTAQLATRTLAEIEPQVVALAKQRDVLTTIREALCADLLACPPRAHTRAEMDHAQGLKVSLLMLDGRFDLQNDSYPSALPLLDQLRAADYTPTQANPLSDFFGSLPTIEQRLKVLTAQRDEAQRQLEAVLRDDVLTTK